MFKSHFENALLRDHDNINNYSIVITRTKGLNQPLRNTDTIKILFNESKQEHTVFWNAAKYRYFECEKMQKINY